MKKICLIICVILLMCSTLVGCSHKELSDGTYTIQVSLSGGSGRASVESPAQIIIKGDSITATIRWSSPYYEYMLINEVQYAPIQRTGNSVFEIPVELDANIAVSASTIAMSEPHLVDYTLCFDSSTIKENKS